MIELFQLYKSIKYPDNGIYTIPLSVDGLTVNSIIGRIGSKRWKLSSNTYNNGSNRMEDDSFWSKEGIIDYSSIDIEHLYVIIRMVLK